jgi:high affinity sulfate transporter 1
VLTGLACIAAGLLRLGFLTNFLSRPILGGYLNGIAISIISGQLGNLFGYPLHPAGFFRLVAEFVSKLGATHGRTLAVGVGTLALLRLLRRLSPQIPGPLIAVALGVAASSALGLGGRGVALLGEIPAGLPRFEAPRVGLADLEALALGAVGLALISFSSAMVTARGFAVKNRYEIDANQEFVALGIADIGAGLSQGFAISGADSRTAVNDSVGGKSQVTGLVAAALIVCVLLFLTAPLSLLPIPVLAAVLVNSALGLFDLRGLLALRRVSHPEFRLSVLTLLGVITVGVLPGVAVAVGVAIIHLLARASRPHDAVLGRMPGTDAFLEVAGHPEAETFPGIVIYRFESALIFFNADRFKIRIRGVAAEAGAGLRCFVLDAGGMPGIDTTGAANLGEAAGELEDKGVVFAVAGANQQVRTLLEGAGVAQRIGLERFFVTLDAAVGSLANAGPTAKPAGEGR